MTTSPLARRSQAEWDRLAASFASARPVRHVVIDNFLPVELAEALFADFPTPEDMPKSRDYVFSDKHELSTLDRHSDASREVHAIITGDEFGSFLNRLAGHSVFIDPEYAGGGFHAGYGASFLDLHTDFNIHPAHPDWHRDLNILLYLNPGWQRPWGGELILTDNPGKPGIKVDPIFNRLVIMECTDTSFHGYHKLNFPMGNARRSVASYAYSIIPEGQVARRTTNWAPESTNPVKVVLAKNWNWIVLTKNKYFGSSTLKNRR